MKPPRKTPGADDVVICVRGLTNRFGDQLVHENLDIDVHRGEILGVVGGSGTGKSVLMRSIIGLQVPDEGGNDEDNFLAAYEQMVPEDIRKRNEELLNGEF